MKVNKEEQHLKEMAEHVARLDVKEHRDDLENICLDLFKRVLEYNKVKIEN